jgi:SprB repeat
MFRYLLRVLILIFLFAIYGCEYKDLPIDTTIPQVDCTKSTLAITLLDKNDVTSCNLIDGNISVEGKGGVTPFAYSINGGGFQTGNTFHNLGPGSYTLTVKDAVLCQQSIQVELKAPGSTLDATVEVTPDNECLTDNGSITVTPSGGQAPYTFQFGTGSFGATSNFTSLKNGFYSVTVKDANGCPKSISIVVPRGQTSVSFAADIHPIITKSCAISGCHNGDNGATRNWTVLANIQKNAQNIKTRTGNKSMPLVGSLTAQEISLIACWVDDGANNN